MRSLRHPASAVQHHKQRKLTRCRLPTLQTPCNLQIAKYSGEKFSLGKVFTTQHHRDVKLGE